MVWQDHLPNARRLSYLLATQDGLFSLSMAADPTLPIIAERGAVLDVVAAIVPKPALQNMVGIKGRFDATADDTLIAVSPEDALPKRVPIQQFRPVVLDRHGPPASSPIYAMIT